jgi:hypothetical protein
MKPCIETPDGPAIPSTTLFGIWIDATTQKPKTGKKVMVCGRYEDGGARWRAMAAFYPAGTMHADNWDEPPDEWWDEDGNNCVCPDPAWWENTIEAEDYWMLKGVTHWMTLPDMPNDQMRDSRKGGNDAN